MRSAILALLKRPDLWPVAWSLAPRRWWRRWPPWPVPPGGYRRFRTETMYGADGLLEARDLVQYLEWCRAMRRHAR